MLLSLALKKVFVQMIDGSFFKLVHHHFTPLLSAITPRRCFLWCEAYWKNSLYPIASEFVNKSHTTSHDSRVKIHLIPVFVSLVQPDRLVCAL